jgi:hypothetical protein
VISARQCSSALASVGLDYLGHEVTLAYHCDKWFPLARIAKHRVLAKLTTSLYFIGDRYAAEKMSPAAWYAIRDDLAPTTLDVEDLPSCGPAIDERWYRALRRLIDKDIRETETRMAAVPREVLQRAYDHYGWLRFYQYDIEESGYDAKCLRGYSRAVVT